MSGPADLWWSYQLKIGMDQMLEVTFGGVSFSTWLPEEVFWMLRHIPLSISIATLGTAANWGVCLGPFTTD